MIKLAGLALVSSMIAGCASDAGDIEDSENDTFLTDDAKADAFGVEDWSPDGAAVLRLVTSATQSKLDGDIGLSSKVAAAIVTARKDLDIKTFTDLAELDAVPYVGKTVFTTLLKYATANHLFKTSLRLPLIVEDENGEKHTLLSTKYNKAAHDNGLTGFARYTFVDSKTDLDKKLQSYNDRLQALATKSGKEITDTMLEYAYSVDDYSTASEKPCYIGDPYEVADTVGAQAGTMTGEMYSIWGWRAKAKSHVEDSVETPDDDFEDAGWKDFDKKSDDVLLVYTNDDDGTHIAADTISRCR